MTASSTIHDNSVYGIYNNTANIINAENNWWATSTGPTGAVGSAVSSYVDYTPWLSDIHFISGEIVPGCPHNCNSVVNNIIFLTGSTKYPYEMSLATSTWNALGNVSIVATTSTTTLQIYEDSFDDFAWKGKWNPSEFFPDFLILNTYHLDQNTSSEIQNTITHELGHALGLDHSFTGNVMYYYQSSQTTLGSQDENDYYYLWP
jgi:hypothetical protein